MSAGAVALFIDATAFTLLNRSWGCNSYIAITISFFLGLLANFILTAIFVFDSERTIKNTFYRYMLASLGTLCFNYLGLYFLLQWNPLLHPFIARIVLASLLFVVNFVIVRRFVFGL